jgi:hypothetical protein
LARFPFEPAAVIVKSTLRNHFPNIPSSFSTWLFVLTRFVGLELSASPDEAVWPVRLVLAIT